MSCRLSFTALNDPARMLWLALLVLSSFGCGRAPQLDTTWGAHAYPSKTASLNGLGFLEKLCVQKGARIKVVNRLSPRLDRVDCLVLIGDTLHPPAKEARDWIEEWLSAKSGRKVIYFGRDFDAAEHYMQATLEEQASEQQTRAGLDLARVRAQRDEMLYEQMNGDYFCRWFYTRVTKPERVLEKFSGTWSDKLAGQLKWPVRAYFDIPDPELRLDVPSWTVKPKPSIALRLPKRLRRPPTVPTQPTPTDKNRTIFTSFWVPDDIGNADEWEREWELAPDVEKLLVGEDGTPLVMRLTSERYAGSEIITLANGAPLLNGMMVEAGMRGLCMNIASEIGDDARIAYLPYDREGIQVSRIPDLEDEVAGLSVLMTWPLNILMAHLAFLGVLICIALFPILGRPQKLKSSNVSDFGQHAEAMGQLLQRTRDLPFALRLVSEYLRTVRGEALPTWVESEITRLAPAATPTPTPGADTGLPPPSSSPPTS